MNQTIDFTLKNINGEMVGPKTFPPSPAYVVIFSCNHCPYVHKYETRIIELYRDLNKEGIPLMVICSNDPINYPSDSFENMVIQAKQKGFPFPYLHDLDQSIARLFGAQRTPEAFVLNTEGEIVYSGAIDDNLNSPESVNRRYIMDVVMELTQKPESTDFDSFPAVGCSIKWA